MTGPGAFIQPLSVSAPIFQYMTNSKYILTGLIAVAVWVSEGNAQTPQPVSTPPVERDLSGKLLPCSRIIGAELRSPAGEKLGTIEDVMIDTDAGLISFAILSIGGFLGIDGKLTPLPWKFLRLRPDRTYFEVDVDKEKLKNGPNFEREKWMDLSFNQWAEKVYSYYNIPPFSSDKQKSGMQEPSP